MMSHASSKSGRLARLTLQQKLLIIFWLLSVVPLIAQTWITTQLTRNYTLELTELFRASETSLAVNTQTVEAMFGQQIFAIWFFAVIIIVVVVSLFTLAANLLTRPYHRLLAQLQQIAEGAFGLVITPVGNYEVDQLILIFNKLTQQLRHLTETSEERIAERTRALETVVRSLRATTDITQRITTILNLDDLLQYIVDNIQKTFGAYHVHIYLSEDDTHSLVMARGSGEVGQQLRAQGHRLKIGEGIVGKVAGDNQYFLSNDVEKTANFIRNPLLPDTQSELAVPLRKGQEVLGVLDIQSRQKDRFEPQDLALIQSLANQTAVAVDNARLFDELNQAHAEIKILNERLKEENLRMGAELDVARQLQTMLLPTAEELQQIETVDIAAFMQPAEEVGGDYYDILQHNGTIKIGIGDVTGHGLESGVVMLMVQTAIRTLLTSEENDPIRFMDILNRTLYDNIARMNVARSLTLALLDYQRGHLRLSGQHEQVIVVRRGGQVEVKDTLELGFPLALERDITPLVGETVIDLQPGDGIVLYSDGITEAENQSGQFYGLERITAVVSRYWDDPAETIKNHVVADVRRFIGDHVVYDDLTLVVVKQR